jgi:hypothetical protein
MTSPRTLLATIGLTATAFVLVLTYLIATAAGEAAAPLEVARAVAMTDELPRALFKLC